MIQPNNRFSLSLIFSVFIFLTVSPATAQLFKKKHSNQGAAPSNAQLDALVKQMEQQQKTIAALQHQVSALQNSVPKDFSAPIAAQGAIHNSKNCVTDSLEALEAEAANVYDSAKSPPSKGRGFYTGAEWTYMKPFGAGRTGLAMEISDDDPVDVDSQIDVTQYDDFESAPRVWLGYENDCGTGLRFSYWDLDQTASLGDPFTSTVDGVDVYTPIGGGLEAYTFDFALTQRGRHKHWDYVVSGGVRHGEFSQSSLLQIDPDGRPAFVQSDRQGFDGWGPRAALEARRRIGCSNLTFVTSTGASLLFGHGRRTGNHFMDDVNFGANPQSNVQFDNGETNALYILEQKIGLEWERALAKGRALSLNAGLEAQLWGGTGDIGGNAMTGNIDGGNTFLLDPSTNTGFIGFTTGAELNF